MVTTGQLLFYGGAALLGLTVLLAIIFIIKKPKYTPESAASNEADPNKTQRLRNGYPTNRLTVRRESMKQPAPETAVLSEETEPLTGTTAKLISTTSKLPDTAVLDAQETAMLTAELQHMGEKTAQLPQDTATELLDKKTEPLSVGTALLKPDMDAENGGATQIKGNDPSTQ